MSTLGHGNAVWFLMRGSGVVALLLLTCVTALGIASVGRLRIGPLPAFATLALHRSVALLSVVFVAIHVTTAVVDPWASVRLVSVVVPFSAGAHALWIGLGALSVDLLVALVASSLLRARIGQRAWRAVHWGAYLAWPIALLHGLGIGSDSSTAWMRAVAVGAIGLAAASLVLRLLRGRPGSDAAARAPLAHAPRPAASGSRRRSSLA